MKPVFPFSKAISSIAGSILLLGAAFFLPGCSGDSVKTKPESRVLHTCLNKILTTLDPALAADTACQYMTAAFYDTLLQYSYTARPYRLEPSMLAEMPEIENNATVFRCRLRDDLYFQEGECFRSGTKQERKITSKDVIFSILRLADTRLKSSGYWLIRGKVRGIDEFRRRTENASPEDLSVYDTPCEGLKIIDDHRFTITLNAPDPRFIYALAMPYFSVVSRKAVAWWGDRFSDHPVGSGPYRLTAWKKDYQIRMKRNPEYRTEYFASAAREGDRKHRLPLLDEIVCSFIKQPLAGWLLFLQGELDFYVLDGENFAAVVNEKLELAPSLVQRGITLARTPEFQTNYIGFNFTDPLLGRNENLRRAISLAFDKQKRLLFFSGRIEPAYGPVPPGADGFLKDYEGPYGRFNVELAKEYMKKAGYPGGMDPETGRNLELTFDQAGSSTLYRQIAEMLAADLKRIGIVLRPEFNNRSRFFQKLNQGQFQLFRLSWTGDYPDAENFLQLFYGPNSDSCNRIFFRDAEFDRMYEEVRPMPDSGERTAKYEKMSKLLTEKCPWIFESYTVSFMLTHRWVTNYVPHDFGFNAWKYFSVDPELRTKTKHSFTPISMGDLRK